MRITSTYRSADAALEQMLLRARPAPHTQPDSKLVLRHRIFASTQAHYEARMYVNRGWAIAQPTPPLPPQDLSQVQTTPTR